MTIDLNAIRYRISEQRSGTRDAAELLSLLDYYNATLPNVIGALERHSSCGGPGTLGYLDSGDANRLADGLRLLLSDSPSLLSSPDPKQDREKTTAADILAQAAETFRERRKVYGDNYLKIGAVCAALYPNGLTLKTADDFCRFELFLFMLVKLSRFSNSALTHKDSIHDASVYGAMLEAITTERKVG